MRDVPNEVDLVREVVRVGDKKLQTSYAYGPSFPAGREWENVSGVLDGVTAQQRRDGR